MNRRHFLNRKCQPRRWPGTPEAGATSDARMPAEATKWHLDAMEALARVLHNQSPRTGRYSGFGAKDNHD